jgi:hypothetical protein
MTSWKIGERTGKERVLFIMIYPFRNALHGAMHTRHELTASIPLYPNKRRFSWFSIISTSRKLKGYPKIRDAGVRPHPIFGLLLVIS